MFHSRKKLDDVSSLDMVSDHITLKDRPPPQARRWIIGVVAGSCVCGQHPFPGFGFLPLSESNATTKIRRGHFIRFV